MQIAEFVHDKLWDPETRCLRRSFCRGPSAVAGFADDYAFLIAGLLDLFGATGNVRWLRWALDLQEVLDEQFWDSEAGRIPLFVPILIICGPHTHCHPSFLSQILATHMQAGMHACGHHWTHLCVDAHIKHTRARARMHARTHTAAWERDMGKGDELEIGGWGGKSRVEG
jgi:hypothetical protein